MNLLVICGRLTRDPEIRSTSGGSSVARYTVAVDRQFKRDGDPDADFFNCTAFGKSAEFAEKYFRQGTKVIVTGRIQQDNYTNKDGEKVYAWTVVVANQEFAESKKAADENGSQKKPESKSSAYVEVPEDFTDEDLPFI